MPSGPSICSPTSLPTAHSPPTTPTTSSPQGLCTCCHHYQQSSLHISFQPLLNRLSSVRPSLALQSPPLPVLHQFISLFSLHHCLTSYIFCLFCVIFLHQNESTCLQGRGLSAFHSPLHSQGLEQCLIPNRGSGFRRCPSDTLPSVYLCAV